MILTIWSGIVIVFGIALFAFVNIGLLNGLSAVVNKSAFGVTAGDFNCDEYFCNQVVYNLVFNPDAYTKCNTRVCQKTVCTQYNCDDAGQDPEYYDTADAYYACYPAC